MRKFVVSLLDLPMRITAKLVVLRCAFFKLRRDFECFFSDNHLMGVGLCQSQRDALAQLRPLMIPTRRRRRSDSRISKRELRWRMAFMLREGYKTAAIASVLKVGGDIRFVRKIRRIFQLRKPVDLASPETGKVETPQRWIESEKNQKNPRSLWSLTRSPIQRIWL